MASEFQSSRFRSLGLRCEAFYLSGVPSAGFSARKVKTLKHIGLKPNRMGPSTRLLLLKIDALNHISYGHSLL